MERERKTCARERGSRQLSCAQSVLLCGGRETLYVAVRKQYSPHLGPQLLRTTQYLPVSTWCAAQPPAVSGAELLVRMMTLWENGKAGRI